MKLAAQIWLILISISTCYGQTIEWYKSIGGSDKDVVLSIDTDDSGNLYVVGEFQGTVDFDPDTDLGEITSIGRPILLL
ncbi:MAG: hypothetical protein OEW75_17610 [Cyclobacteriaceae bacterium]|nr:hypothetical protein [Cyclobacteriaceae bacterium]